LAVAAVGPPGVTAATPLIAGLVRRAGLVRPAGIDSVAMLKGSMAHAAVAASK
jgi:hypothetical protein